MSRAPRSTLFPYTTLFRSLGSAEREAMVQMSHKKVAQERCEHAIRDSVALQAQLEGRRQELLAECDALRERYEREHADVATRTRATPRWQALSEKADRLAGQAALAEADRGEKGRPDEADRLFVYLWQRRYGSASYRAGPLARTLDGWVARLVGWQEAARNYRMLVALPLYLRRHAEELRRQAEAAQEELTRLEEHALAEDGVTALQEQVRRLEPGIDGLSGQIAAEDRKHAALRQRGGELAEGRDEYTLRALEASTRAIEQETSDALRR